MAALLVLLLPHGILSEDEALPKLPINGNHTIHARRVGHQSRAAAAIDDLERHGPKSGLVGSVEAELRPWKPRHPRTGTITGEAPQVHDNDVVGDL